MILCCGDALIDMIPMTSKPGTEAYVPRPGGAVLNTAVALGRLGAPAGLLTGVSHDIFGQKLAAHLTQSHVDTSHILWSDRPTTLAFVQLMDGQASYCFYDENSAGRMLNIAQIPALPNAITALFFGGISLASEPASDCYAALLAREAGSRVVMIDPNIRLGFIKDAARYCQRLGHMMAQADIVKVSDEDLNWLFPAPQSDEQKVKQLLALGPSLVVLTRGGDGADGFLANGSQIHVPATPAEIVDTVGAGDTFNAGLLAKLSELNCLSKDQVQTLSPETLQLALEHGARAAAKTVAREGADPPWAGDL
ncbi:carbohydrate kinase family protein [Pseudophaeobacter arcticus]|uniref:carbohydrate kinase family protein n=1 Tax=Pseudophaeobacter arcticus TaxID=385492 RepID=UPI002493015A|nr:carbohydrate kinase [Pseudophaeobacter arcticus]